MAGHSKEFYRERSWLLAAVRGESWNLKNLPEENPAQPGSQFFGSLLKICAVVKGTEQRHMNRREALAAVTAAFKDRYRGKRDLNEREIERQFSNAWKKARPRQYRPKATEPAGREPVKL